MAVKWHKANYAGVRYREHATRKHGIRYDRCYSIRYTVDGKEKEEVVGWSSEGITAEIASQKRAELRGNSRLGAGAKTLKEKREQNEKEAIKQKQVEAQEALENTTLSVYWENTYKQHAQSTKKRSSYLPEERHMERWILPILGETPLKDVDMAAWDKLTIVLRENNLSVRTIDYVTGTLRRLLKHAKERGFPVIIPTSKQIGIQAVQDNRRLRVLTKSEALAILEALEKVDVHTKRLTQFCMLTGCRLSEAVNLKWGDVDFDKEIVRFTNTKNKDTRIFYFSDDLRLLLSSLFKAEYPNELVFKRRDGKSFFLRPDKSETPYYFVEVVKQLGLNEGREKRDRVSFHTLRHTVATNLAKVLDVRSLMDVMGWKVVSMAARYIHTQEETKRAAANYLASSWNDS